MTFGEWVMPAAEQEGRERAYVADLMRRKDVLMTMTITGPSVGDRERTVVVRAREGVLQLREGRRLLATAAGLAGLPAAITEIVDDSQVDFHSGSWEVDDVAYAVDHCVDEVFVDGVPWDYWPTAELGGAPGRSLPVPRYGEAPLSLLVASDSWEFTSGSGSPASGESGVTELLRIGPFFVEMGDEWASLLRARTKEEAVAEFVADLGGDDDEHEIWVQE